MRVVLADDALLLREGVARLLAEAGFEVVGQSATPTSCSRRRRARRPTSRSSTSACRPPTPTKACAPRARSARRTRSRDRDPLPARRRRRRDGAARRERGRPRLHAQGERRRPREFAGAVRRVADGGSALDPTIVSQLLGRQRGTSPSSADGARARGARADGGGAVEPGIAARLASASARSSSTWRASSRSSGCRRPATTTAACWPCSRSCAPDAAARRRTADCASAAPRDAGRPEQRRPGRMGRIVHVTRPGSPHATVVLQAERPRRPRRPCVVGARRRPPLRRGRDRRRRAARRLARHRPRAG